MLNFRERFLEIVNESGKSFSEIANALDIPKSTISNYSSGRMEPKSDRLHKLAIYLGVNETWLMGYDVDKYRKNPETTEEKRNEIAFLFNLLSPGEQQTVIELIHHLADKQS